MKRLNILLGAAVLLATAPAQAQSPAPPMDQAAPALAPIPPDAVPVVEPRFSLSPDEHRVANQVQVLDTTTIILERRAKQVEALARIATACRSAGLTGEPCAGVPSAAPAAGPAASVQPSPTSPDIMVQRVTGAGRDLEAILLLPSGAALPVRAGDAIPSGGKIVEVSPGGVLVRQDGRTSLLGFSTSAQRAVPPRRDAPPFPNVPMH